MQQRILPFLAVLFFYCNAPAYALPELKAVAIWGEKNQPTPYQPSDSFVYVYSNGRTNVALPTQWDNSSSGTVITGNTIATCTSMFDSCTHYQYGTAHTFDLYRSYSQVFAAGNKLMQYNDYTYDNGSVSFIPLTRTIYTYNTDNTVATSLLLTYNKISTAWDTTVLTVYSYAPGKLLTGEYYNNWDKVNKTWILTGADSNDYDANSNLIKWRNFGVNLGVWSEKRRQIYVYNSSNQLISDTTIVPTWSIMSNNYFYNTGGLLTHWLRRIDSDTDCMVVYSYDANQRMTGNLKSRFNKTTHLFDPDFSVSVTYTATGLVNDWKITPSSPANPIYQKFYYGAAAGNVAAVKDANRMQLYPVPAVAYVNLEAELGAQQDISIMITDMTGRCVKQFKENAAGHYKKFIPLMELPAGTYTITLSGRETTSRQISVIH